MEEKSRGVGRPRIDLQLIPMWKQIILEAGQQGHHITKFLMELGISWDQHYTLMDRNKEYSKTVKEYNKLCEQWWFEQAHTAIASGNSNRFNQRLWTVIMKNKFRDSWSDSKEIDITTGGDKITQDNLIQVEIIKKQISDDSNV
jgi:hypothetical protein